MGIPFFAAMLVAASVSAGAENFRWANDGDIASLDPYARQETFQLSFMANIYEPLVRRDRELKIEPALAESWEQVSPTLWRFRLRANVRFQGGESFSADDVVFSLDRARNSQLSTQVASIKEIRALDPLQIEIETREPNPILLEELSSWAIVSRAWAEANNAARVADLARRDENFATRNANGTGPFIATLREPDQRTVLRAHDGWWDQKQHNLTEIRFDVIANNATRVAALLSGQTDMLYSVPPQDVERIGRTPGFTIVQNPEIRTMFLGFDQWRPELLRSDVKGRNPFQDRRVREAVYLAIDAEAIRTRVMRGQSRVTDLIIGPGVRGYQPDLDHRRPPDLARARQLMAEAGFPDGFSVTLDCSNDRYVNDEAICQAVAPMLARIGIRVTVSAQPRGRFFSQVMGPRYETSFFLIGWTPLTYDVHNILYSLFTTRGTGARGAMNLGGYANPRLDALTDRIAVETDPAAREREVRAALELLRADFAVVPLHQQTVIWATRSNIELAQPADNSFPLRFVRVK